MCTTVDGLIRRLRELSEEGHGDTGVRLAVQPHWPMSHYVENVKYVEDEGCDDGGYVWIAASDSNVYDMPYAPREAWDAWE